ncbi:MAG: right-handed parallel beta-helix repeat-containing protein [Actinobacteria bacterium]|nr:right-handed parallel beta-helix repeat-containing protein [Actinomycetota bacterium]
MNVRSLVTVLLLVVTMVLSTLGAALAHEERESQFPDQGAPVPVHRSIDEAADVIVVCKPESAALIDAMTDPDLQAFNRDLLAVCTHEHIQAAVDAVEVQGTNIYVLPGLYREEPSVDAPCADDYEGGVVTYEQQVSCGEVVNLVTVAGDDPADEDRACGDAPLCNLQIEGTGAEPTDTMLRGGFTADGDWVKHNALKADRADGFYLRNMGFELVRENAIYVHETDGYVLDRVVARNNDLYGILTFAADHGVIRDCETYHNGDSGIYPGSPADVNADSTETGPLDRYAVEVFGCDTHHNSLGFSGTAGNSVYFHDNRVHHNGAGYVSDSFVPNHPGMPQDHAWLEDNLIYANNVNYYGNVQEGGPCRAERPADVGYEDGVVCPVFPVPVGTGIMFAGGNYNFVRNNLIYDNWRQGAMLFWVPAAIRDDFEGGNQYDTSHGNHFVDNTMGVHPDGHVQPNGIDFWWDDQGEGNCWQGNTSTASEDGSATSNSPHLSPSLTSLPDCDGGGSVFTTSNPVKSAALLPCAEYDREDNPSPTGCDWIESPSEPEGREAAPSEDAGADDGSAAPGGEGPAAAPAATDEGGLPATGGPVMLIGLVGLALMTGAVRLRRLRSGTAG